MRGARWWLAWPRLARQCFFKRGAVARPGRLPGVCNDCTPIAWGCLLSAVKTTPQLLAKFYRKRVAVLGWRKDQVALRSCCSTNRTYRPTPYPIVFYEDNLNLNSPRFDV